MSTINKILKASAYPPDEDGANMGLSRSNLPDRKAFPVVQPPAPPKPVAAPKVPAVYPQDADGANMGTFKTPFSVKAGGALELYKRSAALAETAPIVDSEGQRKKDALWEAASSGLSSGMLGATSAGLYTGILHPEALNVYLHSMKKSPISNMFESMNDEVGDSWKNQGEKTAPEAFSRGKFTAEERAARNRLIEAARSKSRYLRAIGRNAAIGAGVLAPISAIAAYAHKRSGGNAEKITKTSALELYKRAYDIYRGPYSGVALDSEIPDGRMGFNRTYRLMDAPGIRAHIDRNKGAYGGGIVGGALGAGLGFALGGADGAVKGGLIGGGLGATGGTWNDLRNRANWWNRFAPQRKELDGVAKAMGEAQIRRNHAVNEQFKARLQQQPINNP